MSYTEKMLAFDVTYNKHQGNKESLKANERANKESDRKFILNYFIKNKTGYSKEIARVMGKQLNQISGRLTELKIDNLIYDTGQRMEGCAVYEINKSYLSRRKYEKKNQI